MVKIPKEAYHSLFHNLVFISFIFLSAWLLFLLRFSRQVQFMVITTFTFFYLIWAIVYHLAKRDLNWKIFIEYLLYAFIAISIGFITILGRV